MNAENEWGPGELQVSRKGCVITITITCPTEYDAMMVYDRAMRDVSRGKLEFGFDTQMPTVVTCEA